MRVIAGLFLLFSCFSFGQVSNDLVVKNLDYKEVFEVDLTKSQIKEQVNKWFALNFKNSNYVIKHSSDDSTIGKGVFNVTIDFTIDVTFKNGRYKLEIYGFQQTTNLSGLDTTTPVIYYYNYTYEQYINLSRSAFEGLDDSYGKKYLLKRLNNEKKSREDYNVQKKNMDLTSEGILSKTESIAQSLFKSVKSNKKDDW